MNLKKSIVVLVILLFTKAYTQEGVPVYFDYLSDNYYLIHPSMAGIGQGGKFRLTARKQWFDQEKAPNLQTINAHARFGERSGLGAIVHNDQNGYHSQTGIAFTYAHHLLFSRDYLDINQLSFGLSLGVIQSNLDESRWPIDIFDPLNTGINKSVSYFNIDAGFSYNFLDFYAHATVKNILGTGRDLYTAEEFNNLRKYLLSVGYVFGNRNWQLEPSVLLQHIEFTKETALDANIKVYKPLSFGSIWAGLSYRTSFDSVRYLDKDRIARKQLLQVFTPILGINYKNWMFAYTYSYQLGDIRFDNGGYHQITVGFDFWSEKGKYDCFCPAVNY